MKIPSAKGNQELLNQYQQVFSALPGVESVEARADTGSIVLNYDPQMRVEFECGLHECCEAHHIVPPHAHPHHHHHSHQHQQQHAEERPGDEIEHMARQIQAEAEYLAAHSESAKVLVDFFRDLDRQIKVSSGNAIDLKIVLAAATPMWVTLAIFGLNHFAELHHQQHAHQQHQQHQQHPLHGMAVAAPAR